MALFNKKTKAKPKVEMASAPEEPETAGETKHIGELDASSPAQVPATLPAPENSIREIPVCLSKEQIYNMVIENNMMLKELMLMANEE